MLFQKLDQARAQDRYYARLAQERSLLSKQYDKNIEDIAKVIVANPVEFTAALQQATRDYYKKIQHSFFRGTGRDKAIKLQTDLASNKNIFELGSVLKNVIKEGNEDHDSLKTFIYQQIMKQYAQNYHLPALSSKLNQNYQAVLTALANAIQKLSVSKVVEDVTFMPKPVINMVIGFLS